ncbi:subtilisin-like protease [Lichtheimia corymbifera JMRC:FSU:9682]|uniref:Subtilisin-like protease n=1 Tax=Lichtheimia corymbifera JMRC:FSU:9682 TaxID=1263082 RepID=A0A068RPN6_9FUNG|nr:subtilisin-like protease [Lichtheimia corymbifera JMRC:FSU:9682]
MMTVTKPTAIGQKAFLWLFMLTGMMLVVVAAGSANDIDHPKWVSFANNNNRQLPGRYIIEFSDDYVGTTEQFLDEVEREHQSFRWTMAHDYHSNRHPDSIFRGISIHMEEQPGIRAANTATMSEHQVMRHVMEKHLVKRVFPVFEVPRPKLHRHNIIRAQALDISPEVSGLPFSHAMTQVNRVHSELGLDGEGVLVGIIDTGVDYNHPSLGGGFGPGYKVAKGYDLVGDDLDVKNPGSLHPGKTPLDTCAGHGTHVAGIIAAEDEKYASLFQFFKLRHVITYVIEFHWCRS